MLSVSSLLQKSSVLLSSRCSRVAAWSAVLYRRSMGHTVRVILTEDLPSGNAHEGDVIHVKAGYARNLLVPRKMALYATPSNFERLGMKDPDVETAEEKRQRLEQERLTAAAGGEELKAAELLKHYLRNKVLKIWRHVDPNTNTVHPGVVTAQNIKDKLSNQLMIDMEDDGTEQVHLLDKVISHDEATAQEDYLESIMDEISTEEECQVQIRQLGEFVAKISLAGGYVVPLKFVVLKR